MGPLSLGQWGGVQAGWGSCSLDYLHRLCGGGEAQAPAQRLLCELWAPLGRMLPGDVLAPCMRLMDSRGAKVGRAAPGDGPSGLPRSLGDGGQPQTCLTWAVQLRSGAWSGWWEPPPPGHLEGMHPSQVAVAHLGSGSDLLALQWQRVPVPP